MHLFISIALAIHFTNLIAFMLLSNGLRKINKERWFTWTMLLGLTSILLITVILGLNPVT